MGSGDLNLLKSWNPKLVKNREKVWIKENELLKEDAKLKERQAELQKEKELNDLVGTKTRGLDWMYNDPLSSGTKNNEFLLGKKKLDSTVINQSQKKESDKVRQTETITTTKATKKFDYSLDDPMSTINKAKRSHQKHKRSKKLSKVSKH